MAITECREVGRINMLKHYKQPRLLAHGITGLARQPQPERLMI